MASTWAPGVDTGQLMREIEQVATLRFLASHLWAIISCNRHNDPLNCRWFESSPQAVQYLYQGNDPEARKAAEKWLRQLQRKPEGWVVPMCLLDSTKVSFACVPHQRPSIACMLHNISAN